MRGAKPTRLRLLGLLFAGSALLLLVVVAWWVLGQGPDPVPRVLFAETAGATAREPQLVAGVMHNRLGHPAFGNCRTLRAVVLQPGAFSCVGDRANTNWRKSRHPEFMAPVERVIWLECLALVASPAPSATGPTGRPLVYYHGRQIGKPKSWDNPRWHAVAERVTEHFVFYSILPARR